MNGVPSAHSSQQTAVSRPVCRFPGKRPYTVRCAECAASASLPAYRCSSCDGPLVLDAGPIAAEGVAPEAGALGLWRYAGLLPRTRAAVTLGEASTPLVPLTVDVGATRRVRVYGKLESLNPTLSFKDRGMALAASFTLDLGLRGLSLASTGNAAASAAAYAAAAGLQCQVVCATGSRAGIKLAAAAAYGAEVVVVDGDYSDAYAHAVGAEAEGWFNVTTTYRNPVTAEAYRGIAAELLEQLGSAPDVVVVPVGAGPLLRGLLGGFRDLASVAAVERVPRLVGVQARACAPLAAAWASDNWLTSLQRPLTPQVTAATAIADSLRGYEREGLLTLEAVRASGGTVVAVSEDQIRHATAALAHAGVLVEPAAAATVAALEVPDVVALTPPGATVTVMLTGHGAKEPLPTPVASSPGKGCT